MSAINYHYCLYNIERPSRAKLAELNRRGVFAVWLVKVRVGTIFLTFFPPRLIFMRELMRTAYIFLHTNRPADSGFRTITYAFENAIMIGFFYHFICSTL